MFSFQFVYQIVDRAIDNAEAFVDNGARDRKREVCLAEAGASHHNNVGRGEGEILGVVHAVEQNFLHGASCLLRIIGKRKTLKGGERQRSQRIEFAAGLIAQRLAQALALDTVHIAGIPAFGAGIAYGQVIRRESGPAKKLLLLALQSLIVFLEPLQVFAYVSSREDGAGCGHACAGELALNFKSARAGGEESGAAFLGFALRFGAPFGELGGSNAVNFFAVAHSESLPSGREAVERTGAFERINIIGDAVFLLLAAGRGFLFLFPACLFECKDPFALPAFQNFVHIAKAELARLIDAALICFPDHIGRKAPFVDPAGGKLRLLLRRGAAGNAECLLNDAPGL